MCDLQITRIDKLKNTVWLRASLTLSLPPIARYFLHRSHKYLFVPCCVFDIDNFIDSDLYLIEYSTRGAGNSYRFPQKA